MKKKTLNLLVGTKLALDADFVSGGYVKLLTTTIATQTQMALMCHSVKKRWKFGSLLW